MWTLAIFNGIHHYRNLSTASLFGSSAEIALRSVALTARKLPVFVVSTLVCSLSSNCFILRRGNTLRIPCERRRYVRDEQVPDLSVHMTR